MLDARFSLLYFCSADCLRQRAYLFILAVSMCTHYAAVNICINCSYYIYVKVTINGLESKTMYNVRSAL